MFLNGRVFAKFVHLPNGYHIDNFPATLQNKANNDIFPFELYGIFEHTVTVSSMPKKMKLS